MDNRVITLLMVVIIGVLIGVGVLSKQGNDPALQQIANQQTQILNMLEGSGGDGGNNNAMMMRLRELEGRIARLENKLSSELSKIQEAAKAAPAPKPAGPPPEDFDKVYDIPVMHSYVRGPKDAPITIVEFSDLECPFCARFHKPVLEVLEAYPDKVNFILKNFPLSFHANARPAAKAALAAGEQGKYFEMVDKLLENFRSLGDATYENIAKEIGLDIEKWKADLKANDAKYEDMINKDISLGSAVSVRGTPTFFLNGKKTLARDFQRFKSEIDAILNQ